MKKVLTVLLILSLLFCSSSAFAAGQLYSLIDSAQELLFATDNVTLTGHAVFSLDGERFKTADILYQQDGTGSVWQLDLLTPRLYRPDQHTGFTVVANGEPFYVIENYYPGVYKSGSGLSNDTVLRRSIQSDHLVSMALSLADSLEALLPADAMTLVSETPEGRELKISLTGSSVPALLNTSLNMAVEFALHRFMDMDYDDLDSLLSNDRSHVVFDNYDTVTLAILYAVDHFTLNDAAIQLILDSDYRLQMMFGAVSFLLHIPEESDRLLDISFDLSASDYGSTVVSEFDPEQYGVIAEGFAIPELPEVDPDLADQLTAAALEGLKAAGYQTDSLTLSFVEENDGMYRVVFAKPNPSVSSAVTAFVNDSGNILTILDGDEEWYLGNPHEPTITALPEEDVRLVSGFMSQAFPDLSSRCAIFKPIMEYTYNDVPYLYVLAFGPNGEDVNVSFILRENPEMKIIEYTCIDF